MIRLSLPHLFLTMVTLTGVCGCATAPYAGVSGINGRPASRQEARLYWRAKGYDFGPEVATVPRMEELAALHTPAQWANRATRRASLPRSGSTIDIDGTKVFTPATSAPAAKSHPLSAEPAIVDVPLPLRKTLPSLE